MNLHPFFSLQPYQTPVSPNMRLKGAILILDIPELDGWLVLVPQCEELQTGLGAGKTTLRNKNNSLQLDAGIENS